MDADISYVHGIILALLSALLRGISFIFNKKSTIEIRARSTQEIFVSQEEYLIEGDAQFPDELNIDNWLEDESVGASSTTSSVSVTSGKVVRSGYWWLFLLLKLLGAFCDIIAFNMAPAIMVAPVGAMAIVVSSFAAWCCMGDHMNRFRVTGMSVIVMGCVAIVINSKPSEHFITFHQFVVSHYFQTPFLMYAFFNFVLACLISMAREKHYMFRLVFCALLSAYIHCGSKVLCIAFNEMIRPDLPDTFVQDPIFWSILLMVAIIMGIYLINITKAISRAPSLNVALPIYFTANLLTIVTANMILFKEYKTLTAQNVLTIGMSLGVVLVGVFEIYGS